MSSQNMRAEENNYWLQWLQDSGSSESVGSEVCCWLNGGGREISREQLPVKSLMGGASIAGSVSILAPASTGVPLPSRKIGEARGEGGHDARDILSEKVAGCSSLGEIREVLAKERLGVLREIQDGASNLVYTDGVENAKVLVIGEAPGREEDKIGLPFVGRSGQLLDKMLVSIGLSRKEQVLLTNVVYWRPPGNRNPSDSEVLACSPVVEKTIEIVKPQIILLMGAVPMRALMKNESSVGSVRGKHQRHLMESSGKTYDLLVTFHPSYLLQAPKMKAHAWRDMLTLKKLTEAATANDDESITTAITTGDENP